MVWSPMPMIPLTQATRTALAVSMLITMLKLKLAIALPIAQIVAALRLYRDVSHFDVGGQFDPIFR